MFTSERYFMVHCVDECGRETRDRVPRRLHEVLLKSEYKHLEKEPHRVEQRHVRRESRKLYSLKSGSNKSGYSFNAPGDIAETVNSVSHGASILMESMGMDADEVALEVSSAVTYSISKKK